MKSKQEHSGEGDNVNGNKIIKNNIVSETSINSKIETINNYKSLNFEDDVAVQAFKELIIDFIKEEENKSHNIVPISNIRNKFNIVSEDSFVDILKQLNKDNSIEVSKVQVCFIPKKLNYSIEI